jgi:glycosyltransferase involved in cell wall biosynthesis
MAGSEHPKIVGAVIARDEERHLDHCLESLAWTDQQLVVLDSRTTDRSAEVARARGAAVVSHPFTTFPAQRNAALAIVQDELGGDWVLFVDADERTPPMLAAEVRAAISRSQPDAPVGYWVPRRNYIWRGWIRHGGWSPDHQLRLLRVNSARYDEQRDVHELAVLEGPSAQLAEPFIHFNYERIGQFLDKQRQYTRLEAQRLARAGQRARPQNFLLQPLREFRRRYVDLAGYRDGWRGALLCGLLAWYTFELYVELARGPITNE